jgi:peptide/nickel transport system permease protein
MIKYITRKLMYSILVIVGVLFITFLLFRVAAGDPSSMLLGKNPSPSELENLRERLDSNKPLIYGRWKKTEIYSSADFASERQYSGVLLPENSCQTGNSLSLPKGTEILFSKNFQSDERVFLAEVKFDGAIDFDGRTIESDSFSKVKIPLNNPSDKIKLKALAETRLYSAAFYKKNHKPLDSQIFSAIKEMASFSSEFPYIKFFNFGKTLVTRERVDSVIWRSVWPSLGLMLPIFILELVISIPLAIFAVMFIGKWPDRAITAVSVFGMSVSYIVLIVLGQWFFAYYLGLFPVWGFENASYLILPVILGTVSGLGGSVRFYRTVFANELKKEYLRTAAAKGCSPVVIYLKHMLGNAAVPIIARASTVLPFLFTGSLLLESFFGIPGLGFASINALRNSDIQMLKALVLLTSVIFICFNMLADILNAWVDPRIRLE